MKYSWSRLDNAAKIFPSAIMGTDTQVFRFSCELVEDIHPELLQKALLDTMEKFPFYHCTLRRGFFWYYLENTKLVPQIREEYRPPCSPIYDRNKVTLLFEVTYYKNRINLEVFHVLSDGTGVMNFLHALITKYLSVIHGLEPPVLKYDASFTQKEDDSFAKHYEPGKEAKSQKQGFVSQIKGARLPDNRMRVIQGLMSVTELKKAAHTYHATVTAFLAACFLVSLSEEMTKRDLKKPVSLVVPVNLRNFFESESARNFFSVVFLNYDFSKESNDFKTIVEKLNQDLKNKLTLENMEKRLNSLFSLEKNVFARIIPLVIKDIGLRIAYRYSDYQSTASLSNVGINQIPQELKEYVRTFYVACATSKMQACVCSYEDTITVTFTSPIASTDIERRFFRKLADFGIRTEISANQIDA